MIQLVAASLSLTLGAAAAPAAQSCPPLVLASALHKIRDNEPWCAGTPDDGPDAGSDDSGADRDAGSDDDSSDDRDAAGLRLAAARNEYESFQVVVNRPNATVESVALRFSGGPADGVTALNGAGARLVHRAHYIDIKKASDCDGGPGRWPDALVPVRDPWFGETRNALPAPPPAEALLLFFVDLFVAPGVPAGNYSATVTVSFGSSGGGAAGAAAPAELEAKLTLRVFGFELPSTSTNYKSCYGVSSQGILMAAHGKAWRQHTGEMVNLTQRYMQLGLMHRLSFTHGGLPDPALGKQPVDWPDFLSRWSDYIGGGVDLPFGLKGAAFTAIEVSTAQPINAEFYAFAKKGGWAHKLASKVCDEPSSPGEWAGCASTCASVHNATPDALCEVTTTLGQLQTANQSQGAITADEVGIFTALINFVENSAEHCSDFPPWCFRDTRPDYDSWMKANPARELWMYQSCMSEGCDSGIDLSLGCDKVPAHKHWPCESGWPSLMIDAPAIMNRIFPSLGYHYGASGELYWQTNYADTCTRENVVGNCPVSELPAGQWGMDAWTDQLIMGGNGDGNLLYPGTVDKVGGSSFIPIASIRLKQLRDGMEDNEYLHMLEAAAGRKQALALLGRVVTNAFSYTRDVGLWERTREAIGNAVEAAARRSQ